MDIGFTGLGNMGHAIVENMLKAGHPVRVWNRTRSRAEPLATARGVISAIYPAYADGPSSA